MKSYLHHIFCLILNGSFPVSRNYKLTVQLKARLGNVITHFIKHCGTLVPQVIVCHVPRKVYRVVYVVK